MNKTEKIVIYALTGVYLLTGLSLFLIIYLYKYFSDKLDMFFKDLISVRDSNNTKISSLEIDLSSTKKDIKNLNKLIVKLTDENKRLKKSCTKNNEVVSNLIKYLSRDDEKLSLVMHKKDTSDDEDNLKSHKNNKTKNKNKGDTLESLY